MGQKEVSMKKLGAISFVLFVLAVFGSAMFITSAAGSSKSSREVSHSLKRGATSFTLYVPTPKKIILYPESREVTTSYSIVCKKGDTITRKARTFNEPFTRNLLYQIPSRQDFCTLAIAGATPEGLGQIVVDISY